MMKRNGLRSTRRGFLGGTLAAAGALAMPAIHTARAQDYPSRNFRVAIPSPQGGTAERFTRGFTTPWSKILGQHFELDFLPGASGQIAYETFVNQRPRDGYNLLCGNMAPEIVMYVVQEPGYNYPDDYFYFSQLDADDLALYVHRDSDIMNMQDLVEAGRSRPLNAAVTRIAHPMSIGILALADATGTEINLIPYGGGAQANVAVLNREADFGAQGVTAATRLEEFRIIGVFNDVNIFEEETEGALPINEALGTNIPPLFSARGWAIHTQWAEENPEQFAILEETSREAHASDEFRAEMEATGTSAKSLIYGDREACAQAANDMLELAMRYKDTLSAEVAR